MQNSAEVDVLPATGQGAPVAVAGIQKWQTLTGFDWMPCQLLVSEGGRLVDTTVDEANP